MIDEIALNKKVLMACKANVIDYELVESLLKQGAKPLGKVIAYGKANNLYKEIVDVLFFDEETDEDFYKITELFLRYNMDISKPSIPYDGLNILNPLWSFSFASNDVILRTLRLLLDNGLSADAARECWDHAICDFVQIDGDLIDEDDYESFRDFIRKIMLIASYPHVLNSDLKLQEKIWLKNNCYDVTKFRDWNLVSYEIDTSHCSGYPQVYRSIVTIIEKSSGKAVWKFGICLKPEDI